MIPVCTLKEMKLVSGIILFTTLALSSIGRTQAQERKVNELLCLPVLNQMQTLESAKDPIDTLQRVDRSVRKMIDRHEANPPRVLSDKVLQRQVHLIEDLIGIALSQLGIQFRKVNPLRDERLVNYADREVLALALGPDQSQAQFERNFFEIVGVQSQGKFSQLYQGFKTSPVTGNVLVFVDPLMNPFRARAVYQPRHKIIRISVAGLLRELKFPWKGVFRHEIHHAFADSQFERTGNMMRFYFNHRGQMKLPRGYERGFYFDEIEAHLRDLRLDRIELRAARAHPLVRLQSEVIESLNDEVKKDLQRLKLFMAVSKASLQTAWWNLKLNLRSRIVYRTIQSSLDSNKVNELLSFDRQQNSLRITLPSTVPANEVRKKALVEIEVVQARIKTIEAEINRVENAYFPKKSWKNWLGISSR